MSEHQHDPFLADRCEGCAVLRDALPATPPASGDACSVCGVPFREHPDTDACAIRAESGGLDVERLETAMARYGVHIDKRDDRKHEVPCESCQPALTAIAAEYARLAEDADKD